MKRYIEIILLIMALLLAACNESADLNEDYGLPEKPPHIGLTTLEKIVPNVGYDFNMVVETNVPCEMKEKPSWIDLSLHGWEKEYLVKVTITESQEEYREDKVIFKTKENPDVTAALNIIQTDRVMANAIGGTPDPWIIKHGDDYYFIKAIAGGIAISKSPKLSVLNSNLKVVWSPPKDAGDIKPWNVANIWAPELHYIEGNWYIYYTAGRPIEELGHLQQHCGVLRAKTDDPLGVWEDLGMLYTGDEYHEGITPSGANTVYGIDLTTFVINGERYASWSGDLENKSGTGQHTFIAKMSNPYTIVSNRVRLSSAEQIWETNSGNIQEGQAFLQHGNKAFIVYSCNSSTTKFYRLGYLMLDDITKDPMNPANWTKSPDQVFYRCDDRNVDSVNGVGHCSFTKSPDGTEDWIVYHSKNRNDNGYTTGRSTFIKKFTWNADDTPNFGTPPSRGEVIVAPSGESSRGWDGLSVQ